MFLLRAALALFGLAVLVGLLMWVLTSERVYLRWAGRLALVLLVLALVWLGVIFGSRLLVLNPL
ncbi:hypothetical protein [Thiohalorhabdus sp.]|uniref:hypothetical protein n=1 Tax=Thiohalorhabdus sp. TaxID=3094134 RepID=UPI002FC38310